MAQKRKVAVVAGEYLSSAENSTGHLMSEVIEALSAEYNVITVTVPKSQKGVTSGRLISVAKKSFLTIKLMVQIRKNSGLDRVLITCSNPFLNWYTLGFLGKFSSVNFIVFDIFPETASDLARPELRHILQLIRNFLLPKSVNIFCIGRGMLRYISNEIKNNKQTDYLHYTPIWVQSKDDNTAPLNLGSLVYFGNFGEVAEVKALTSFCKQLSDELTLKIVGRNASSKLSFLSENKYIKLSNEVSFSERKSVYNDRMASLVIQRPSLKNFAVPSKAFYSWENGLPILYFGSRDSELYQLVTSNRFLGIAFDFSEVGRDRKSVV